MRPSSTYYLVSNACESPIVLDGYDPVPTCCASERTLTSLAGPEMGCWLAGSACIKRSVGRVTVRLLGPSCGDRRPALCAMCAEVCCSWP